MAWRLGGATDGKGDDSDVRDDSVGGVGRFGVDLGREGEREEGKEKVRWAAALF